MARRFKRKIFRAGGKSAALASVRRLPDARRARAAAVCRAAPGRTSVGRDRAVAAGGARSRWPDRRADACSSPDRCDRRARRRRREGAFDRLQHSILSLAIKGGEPRSGIAGLRPLSTSIRHEAIIEESPQQRVRRQCPVNRLRDTEVARAGHLVRLRDDAIQHCDEQGSLLVIQHARCDGRRFARRDCRDCLRPGDRRFVVGWLIGFVLVHQFSPSW